MSGKEVCAILERHGFVEARRRGSHIVMQRVSETGMTSTCSRSQGSEDRDPTIDHSAIWRTQKRI
jgi:predicted RNA binding protein YcfA (HicA-like mRNA interferase family)